MIYVTPTPAQQLRIERWLTVAKRKSVYVVDDTMIAVRNLDARNYIEILLVDDDGVHTVGRYNRTINIPVEEN